MLRLSARVLSACALMLPAAAAAAAPAAAHRPDAGTRACPQADPQNGITSVRAAGLSCRSAFAVARRTNSVRCFLNGNSCTHSFRGRSWRCRFKAGRAGGSVRCVSRRLVVTYRTP